MRYEDLYKEIEENSTLGDNIKSYLFDAFTRVYPMIVYANLTKNTYAVVRNEGFLYGEIPLTGKYDDMIEKGAVNIQSSFRQLFIDTFGREALINEYAKGKRMVECKIYQKSDKGNYQWVLTKTIRINDQSGDVVHLCLNQIIAEENKDRYGRPIVSL